VSTDKSKPFAKPGAADAEEPSVPDPNRAPKNTGRVQFDSRGNAVWEWAIDPGAFDREVSTERLRRLEHPALSIAEDAPTPFDVVRPNPLGTKKGYDPYDSGRLAKTAAASRKKDLRRLSEFMKLKKQAASNKED